MRLDGLGVEDLPAIAALVDAGVDRPHSEAELRTSLFDVERPALVRGDPTVGVVATVERRGQWHVRLLVVHPRHRGQGFGSELLAASEADVRAAGGDAITVGTDAPDYLYSGVDTRETALLSLLESRRYRMVMVTYDMRVDLATLPPAPDVIEASPAARQEVSDWLHANWPNWWEEAIRSFDKGSFVFTRDAEGINGFCAWNANRTGWLGPMAVRPDGRQHGVGTPLLLGALHRMRSHGPTAEIAWVGPLAFYAKTVGARVSTVYFVYRKGLS
jgi:GNAT superfamily N-acetyltransferase